ncbi:MAG: hypothetical protein M3068_00380 [Gemmatimonadota bacterium]|nr:hypothetical protein [Gemmatimonadota bacterium]
MSDKTILLGGLLTIIFSAFLIFLILRLRRFATQRMDAERRSAVAFEQMLLMSKELQKKETEPVPDEMSPGERLKKIYPGVGRPGSSASTEGRGSARP